MKKRIIITIISILAIGGIGTGGYLVYDNFIKEKPSSSPNETKKTEPIEKNSNITLEVKDLEVKVNEEVTVNSFVVSCKMEDKECVLTILDKDNKELDKIDTSKEGKYTFTIKATVDEEEVTKDVQLTVKAEETNKETKKETKATEAKKTESKTSPNSSSKSSSNSNSNNNTSNSNNSGGTQPSPTPSQPAPAPEPTPTPQQELYSSFAAGMRNKLTKSEVESQYGPLLSGEVNAFDDKGWYNTAMSQLADRYNAIDEDIKYSYGVIDAEWWTNFDDNNYYTYKVQMYACPAASDYNTLTYKMNRPSNMLRNEECDHTILEFVYTSTSGAKRITYNPNGLSF